MTHQERIDKSFADTINKTTCFREMWGLRHCQAFASTVQPLAEMVKAWAMYADVHYERYNSNIGEDMVLGKDWSVIGQSLLGLLNGELGGLDGGTMDSLIRSILQAEGFDPDTM